MPDLFWSEPNRAPNIPVRPNQEYAPDQVKLIFANNDYDERVRHYGGSEKGYVRGGTLNDVFLVLF